MSIASYQTTRRNSRRQLISATQRWKHEVKPSFATVMLDKVVADWRSGDGVEEDAVHYCKCSIGN